MKAQRLGRAMCFFVFFSFLKFGTQGQTLGAAIEVELTKKLLNVYYMSVKKKKS